MEDSLFDAHYYKHNCGEPYQRSQVWLDQFNRIADFIVKEIHPATVLDAGCALGLLVETLRDRGVEAYGIDISEYAIANVYPPIKPYCQVGSIVDPLPGHYDLIVTIEVLEHLQGKQYETAIYNLCQASDSVLFSSTPFDYKELTHFNVQMPEFWGEAFARNGFYRDVDFDASFITPWAVLYRKREEPFHRIVRDYERRFWPLNKENLDLRSLALEMREQNNALVDDLKTNEEQYAADLQKKDEQYTADLKKNEEQYAVDLQKNLEQYAADLKEKDEQNAAELKQLLKERDGQIQYIQQFAQLSQPNNFQKLVYELVAKNQGLTQEVAELRTQLDEQRKLFEQSQAEWKKFLFELENTGTWKLMQIVRNVRNAILPGRNNR